MAQIKGQNVIAPVVPFDTTDVHPSHEARYGKGGYRTVATLAERDAIPAPRREAGMLVFVTADGGSLWQLGADLATWSEFSAGVSSWNDLSDKPSTFPPSAHAHTIAEVSGLAAALDGKQAAGSYAAAAHGHVAADIFDFTAAVVAAAPPTTNASLLTSGTLDFSRLPFTVTYPVRAVHVGGILSFNNWAVTTTPTYFWGGSGGDLRTLATMEYPATAVSVDVSASATKYIADNPGRTLTYASLEVVLVDAAGRIVGWGTTSTVPATGPTNGTAGTSMTVPLLSFPTVPSANWVIGGLQTSGNVTDITPIAAYKRVASRHIDIDRTDWANIPNKPTFAAVATSGSAADLTGTLADARLSSNIARVSDVTAAVAAVVDAAPASLDTLNELAAALGDDANFAATVTNALAAKAPLASPAFTGTVSGITKAMVGLGNVDNTSDASKPISTATQAALDAKAAATHTHVIADVTGLQAALDGKQASGSYAATVHTHTIADVTGLEAALNGKASLTGAQFTGNVDAPAVSGDLAEFLSVYVGPNELRSATFSGVSRVMVNEQPIVTTDDARLSNARTPTAHKSTHATGGTDALTPSDIGAAAASHTHAAGDITSGTLSAARLGSGTASSSTWLRGDQTWASFIAGTRSVARFTARDNQPPATAFATLDTRNSVMVLEFDAAVDEAAVFLGVMPEGVSTASGLVVRIVWMADTATGGNVRWGIQFEEIGTDLDADSYDTATLVTSAANATSGIETVAQVTCTTIDGIAAGDRYRLRIYRDADDAVNDTMTGDAQLVAVEVRVA